MSDKRTARMIAEAREQWVSILEGDGDFDAWERLARMAPQLADALSAARAKASKMRALAKDHFAESERMFDKLVAVRAWADENRVHEVYEATDDEPAECTDECEWCTLDRILDGKETK